eukprot:8341058-Ditylum_brightwellii.AAC.1
MLHDSGTSSSQITKNFVKKLKLKKADRTTWKTVAGEFGMWAKCKVTFGLPELNPSVHVEHTMHVTNQLGQYNMILRRDLLRELGIKLNFKESIISWGDYQADMKDADVTLAEHIAAVEATTAAATEIAKILDGKYQKVDIRADVVEACNDLNTKEREKLLNVLKKHEELFDSTLGT